MHDAHGDDKLIIVLLNRLIHMLTIASLLNLSIYYIIKYY